VEQFGRISDVGVYAGYTNHFNIGAFMEKGQTMRGSQVRARLLQAWCTFFVHPVIRGAASAVVMLDTFGCWDRGGGHALQAAVSFVAKGD
jgi:hypothetical protein